MDVPKPEFENKGKARPMQAETRFSFGTKSSPRTGGSMFHSRT
jgi:hypothetical protein